MSQSFSIGPGNPAPKPTQVWGLGSIIGERQETIGSESDYEDMEEVEAAILESFAQPAAADPQDPKSSGANGRKHIFIGLSQEPGLDMSYTDYIYIELETSQEDSVLDYLAAQAKLVNHDLYELAEELESFLQRLRGQPGVIAAGPIEFVHPWNR